jgi:pectin methylesterase-like acyl-CoA thioesterase
MDFVPDHGKQRITVQVKRGIYREIVYFRNKDNVTIRGEAPDQVRVTYVNSEVFNPHPVNLKPMRFPEPSLRAGLLSRLTTPRVFIW